MHTTFVVILLLALLPSVIAFHVHPHRAVATVTRTAHKDVLKEIEKELHDELGQPDIEARHVKAHPEVAPHESLVHKLRLELRAKDRVYHQLLDELEQKETYARNLDRLQGVLEQISVQLQHQNDLIRQKKDISQQQQQLLRNLTAQVAHLEVSLWPDQAEEDETKKRRSVRSLLWQAVKTTGRRVKKVVRRLLFLKN